MTDVATQTLSMEDALRESVLSQGMETFVIEECHKRFCRILTEIIGIHVDHVIA